MNVQLQFDDQTIDVDMTLTHGDFAEAKALAGEEAFGEEPSRDALAAVLYVKLRHRLGLPRAAFENFKGLLNG